MANQSCSKLFYLTQDRPLIIALLYQALRLKRDVSCKACTFLTSDIIGKIQVDRFSKSQKTKTASFGTPPFGSIQYFPKTYIKFKIKIEFMEFSQKSIKTNSNSKIKATIGLFELLSTLENTLRELVNPERPKYNYKLVLFHLTQSIFDISFFSQIKQSANFPKTFPTTTNKIIAAHRLLSTTHKDKNSQKFLNYLFRKTNRILFLTYLKDLCFSRSSSRILSKH